ncbi:MAG: hypothetical protein MI892_30400, partial [Desulfobacterales bacterium]|nr:hypothetical protein [Desulfobacterales bacterium]
MERLQAYSFPIITVVMILSGIVAWAAIEDGGSQPTMEVEETVSPPPPLPSTEATAEPNTPGFAGTRSCRACHENFYKLWAPSHHGLAMQPYTDDYAQRELTEHEGQIPVGKYSYQAKVAPGEGYVLETGPEGTKQYKTHLWVWA